MVKILSRLLDSNERELKKLQPLVEEINSLEPEIRKLSDEQLRAKTTELRGDKGLTRASGQTLDKLLPTAFAVCREAIRHTVGERAFDVQLLAAIALHQGKVVEQRTGEGKTHSAAFALYLNALTTKGCHLVTVNDYLARRDTGWYGQALHFLGLAVGCIVHEQAFLYDPEYTDKSQTDERLAHLRPVSRKEAYQADVTYGTNNEFGFDYLRDNMVQDPSQMVQRGPSFAKASEGAHYFAIVDEVDFALIDEARTPLIISAPAEEAVEKYYDFARLAGKLVSKTDYVVDEKAKSVNLTEIGIRKVERMLGVENLYEKDFETIHHIEAALKAKTLFTKDRDYVVKDNEIIIVDEFTGRLMFGRRYSEGLHQAIEAKENVPIQKESRTMATISFQNYFRMYEKLAGMTGTAATEAEEFLKIYGLDVVVIPTNEPMIRIDNSDVIYKTERAKFQAVVSEIEECHRRGQPVLVGTTSIEKNELLDKFLTRKNIPHEILNAKNHEKEAEIIAQTGRVGAVTVATNMAGRGVDIKLGGEQKRSLLYKETPFSEEYEKVKELGGLHVMGTERHESRRIDNQLRGRSGRQGDSGSSRFFVSLQDDLMRIFGGEQVANLMTRLGVDENVPIEARLVSKSIENAQKKVEGHNFDIRKRLVEYDDVMNKQREIVYRLRRRILGPIDTTDTTDTADAIDTFKDWFLEKISPHIDDAQSLWETKEKEIGKELFEKVVRQIALQTIDVLWIEHLDTLDDLRQGIGLRGYGAREPLVEYKREAREMFERLMQEIWGSIADRIFKVEVRKAPISAGLRPIRTDRLIYQRPELEIGVKQEVAELQARQSQQTKSQPIVRGEKPGRNDPCPCGSGKKYKRCCYPKYG